LERLSAVRDDRIPPLAETVAAAWRRRFERNSSGLRKHWLTRTTYYAAGDRLAAARPGVTPTWRAIVDEVRPRGSASTFYEVTGRNAKYALHGAYVADASTVSLGIALHYRRSVAVEQLLDEAKVWTYWPYREVWLDGGPHPTADSILSTVGAWADDHPGLAATLDFAPPACAVEDLVVVDGGKLPATRAYGRLRSSMNPRL
jgi:hypothetical protein